MDTSPVKSWTAADPLGSSSVHHAVSPWGGGVHFKQWKSKAGLGSKPPKLLAATCAAYGAVTQMWQFFELGPENTVSPLHIDYCAGPQVVNAQPTMDPPARITDPPAQSCSAKRFPLPSVKQAKTVASGAAFSAALARFSRIWLIRLTNAHVLENGGQILRKE